MERSFRIIFGLVTTLFFGGLVWLLSWAGWKRGTKTFSDVIFVAIGLFMVLITMYCLDQLLKGLRPSRKRWFEQSERRIAPLMPSRAVGLHVGRLFGSPVTIDVSVPISLVVFGGLTFSGAFGSALVIVAHELGHAVLVRAHGHQVIQLWFHGLGGECSYTGDVAPRQRRLIAWGGVAAQIIMLMVAMTAQSVLPSSATWEPFYRATISMNVVAIFINLLPFEPLDGAQAWALVFKKRHY